MSCDTDLRLKAVYCNGLLKYVEIDLPLQDNKVTGRHADIIQFRECTQNGCTWRRGEGGGGRGESEGGGNRVESLEGGEQGNGGERQQLL